MIKIFFDQSRPDLIFSLAAISEHRQQISMLIPMDLKKDTGDTMESVLVEGRQWQTENDDIEYVPPLTSEPDELYLLNIGTNKLAKDAGFKRFLLRHEDEIVLWIDSHDSWREEEIKISNRHRKLIQVTDVSPLQVLAELSYDVPDWWRETEESMISEAIGASKTPSAARYCGAFLISKVISENMDFPCLLDYFQESLQELMQDKESEELSARYALLPKMIRKTRRAKQRMSADAVWFREAQLNNRPVGYLRVEHADEYLDIPGIVETGRRRFPWLFVLDYNFQGEELIHAASEIVDVAHMLRYYSELVTDKETLLRCLGTEVVTFGRHRKNKWGW